MPHSFIKSFKILLAVFPPTGYKSLIFLNTKFVLMNFSKLSSNDLLDSLNLLNPINNLLKLKSLVNNLSNIFVFL